jgi:hypothetical protein
LFSIAEGSIKSANPLHVKGSDWKRRSREFSHVPEEMGLSMARPFLANEPAHPWLARHHFFFCFSPSFSPHPLTQYPKQFIGGFFSRSRLALAAASSAVGIPQQVMGFGPKSVVSRTI